MFATRSWAAALGLAVSVLAVAAISAIASSKPALAPAHEKAAPALTAPAETAAEAPKPVPLKPQTPEERGMEESATPITNQSPADLVAGTLAAIERQDSAWLARTMQSRAGKPMLNEVDTLDAHRNFLWRSIATHWRKVAEAWKTQSYQLAQDGDTAELRLEVGGDLGVLNLPLVRIGNAWYFAGL